MVTPPAASAGVLSRVPVSTAAPASAGRAGRMRMENPPRMSSAAGRPPASKNSYHMIFTRTSQRGFRFIRRRDLIRHPPEGRVVLPARGCGHNGRMTDSPASPAPLADPHLVYDPLAGDGPKDVVILGSTGSIGTQAIDLVLRNPDRFRVTALSANGGRVILLAQQAHRLRVRTVAVAREDVVGALRDALAARYGPGEPLPEILAGAD